MSTQTWIQRLLSADQPAEGFEPPSLLAADADRVTDYVFETPGLPEMRGASAQLKALNQEVVQHLFQEAGLPSTFVDDTDSPGCLVYAAGGGLLALVPAAQAPDLQAAVERAYPQQTGAATTTCVWLPTGWAEVHTAFGSLVERAGAALRARKQAKTHLPFFETLPVFRRCDACRKRPAVQVLRVGGEAPEFRCRACAEKRRVGQALRSEWYRRLGVPWPEGGLDLEQIGAAADGYIGVIYADGNGLGDWFQQASSIDEFRRRSILVQESVDQAVEAALRLVWDEREHLFEVLLVGGDDALLVVPAGDALLAALALGRAFEEAMGEDHRAISAGVILADHHTPVYFLRRLAADLLKSAKRAERGSTVDFLVLKGQGTRSAEQARQRVSLGLETLIMNHGPYTLDELSRLLENVRQGRAGNFPRAQLYALRDALQQGRQAGALAFLYAMARARDQDRPFLESFRGGWFDEANETPPWRQDRVLREGAIEYRTPWADLVDVWDFVE